ncbi:hypothetical protein LCGC14_1755880 [marine sediment metagenome]|uniref:Uncharacterized protein n=1 Tax=marine sediment metagenome TaxID=412755 RepID=A0A0F9JHQ4_9ZZZZ
MKLSPKQIEVAIDAITTYRGAVMDQVVASKDPDGRAGLEDLVNTCDDLIEILTLAQS